MATGLAPAVANSIVDALLRNVSWTQPAAVYIKLHLGDPGAAGTANPATETTRKSASFSAASGGATSNTGLLSWASYPATETITHISAWDALTLGNFCWSDALDITVGATAGDTLQIAIGDLDVSLVTVAA